MKYLKSIAIILGVYLIADLIQGLLKLPIPSSVLGMCIMLVLLITKIIKLELIEELVDFLLKHLGLLFIPGGVALMGIYDVISKDIITIIIVIIVTTAITLLVAGKVIDIYMEKKSNG